jgi:hypothetical protein
MRFHWLSEYLLHLLHLEKGKVDGDLRESAFGGAGAEYGGEHQGGDDEGQNDQDDF